MKRDSFVFYRSFFDAIKSLPKEDKNDAIYAICAYGIDGIIPEDISGIAKSISIMAKHYIDITGVRGGIKGTQHNINKSIRNTKDYRIWRKNVFIRDNFTCQHCGRTNIKLHAHHIKQFSQFPELRFNINNGISLCKNCHDRIHTKI